LVTTYSLNNDGLPDSVTLPNGNVITYTRDALHRLTEITDAQGNKTVNTYDTESRKTREEFQDPSAVVKKFTNFGYDSYNRLQYVYFNATVPPAAGSIYWAYTYDNAGNQTSVKDPLGHLVCYEYDALSRKKKTHQYLGTAPAACLGTCTAPGCVDLLTQFGYDTQDHLTSVTDPGGLVTTYTVDDAAQVIEQVSPDTGTATSTYDEAGSLHTRTNANGTTETRSYDALNRLSGTVYPDTSNNVGYSYDSPDVAFGLGKRTGMADPSGASAFSYDFAGRLVEEERTPSGQPNVFTLSGWDKNGNLTGLTYPSGRSATFTVNTSDQVTGATATVNGASATIVSNIGYMPFGPHSAVTFGNGLSDARTFDSRYRMGNWTLGGLISKTYGWQDDDNITGITDNLNAANNRVFGYDATHRLTTANGPWGSGSYSYDANGSRLTKVEGASSTTYSYYTGTNRLQTATGSEPGSYSYDSNGNTTGDGTRTYQYSQRDRLATVDSGTTGTYSYDGDGRRVKKVAGGVTTMFFYDPEGRLLEEYIPVTGAGKDYLWLPGTYEPLARVDFSLADADTGNVLRCTKSSPNVHLDWSLFGGSGNFIVRSGALGVFNSFFNLNSPFALKTLDDPVLADANSYWYDVRNRTLTDALYFYHADHLGTSIAMTDTTATLVWRAEHTPFGGIYALTVGTITNNLRFPGQYYDGETGLAQNYFRDYMHNLGRYWEPDPMSQLNDSKYDYSQNDPITRTDRRGLKVELCCRPVIAPGSGILHLLGIDHCWLKTGSKTAGMGDVGGHAAWWEPIVRDVPVQVTDQRSEKHGKCKEISCMDEGCVNKALQEGRPLGNFSYLNNNCRTFAISVIRKCHRCCNLPAPPPLPRQHWPGGFY
jgi:RHS repeat-associated protein